MKFFLDTAVVDEIREGVSFGLVDGVTTNPSLIAKSGRPFREVIEEIVGIVDGPISAEVVSTDLEGMLREGRELAKIHDNIVVKVPLIQEGLKATRAFAAEGIKTNVTLCFSATQALLAAKAGATYISPFVGRLDDISHVGLELVEHILTIYENYGFDTEIIVASIRNPLHVQDAARMGAHIGTMPLGVMKQLMKHPLTDIGLANFLKDYENSRKG
ncbi:MAG: fructose-6-phosphate aldolase [Leptospirillia bacterium]